MRPAERLRYLVLAAQREGNRILAGALRPIGLTPSQAEVLRVLEGHGPISLTGLGELLICENGTNPSRLVDRLVAAGLVDRRPDLDRRRVMLSLSNSGLVLERKVRAIEEALYEGIDQAGDATSTILYLDRIVAGTAVGASLAARNSAPS